MTFSDLMLQESILSALSKLGFTEPTPIQKQSIPYLLQGRDLFGCAQTGTGKTAAFALPIIQTLSNKKREGKPRINALILAPTRELANQISEGFTQFGANTNLKHLVIFGGVSQQNQVNKLRQGVDILIATPGRLLDLMNQGFVNLQQVEHFVLDEADRMLDMGFINDIKKILPKLPAQKQTLFFSATAPADIMELANKILRNPVKVAVNPVSSAAEPIEQFVYFVQKEDKRALLKHVLVEKDIQRVLVFTRTKHGADKLVKDLNKSGIKAEAIHGNKSQNAREKALKQFKDRHLRVLVATDIASRGIDVDKLSHVINYELPEVSETYIHRIGRTGRAGEKGMALSFCSKEESAYLRSISKQVEHKIEEVRNHPYHQK
ncbi:MAG: DEAD/DEAH box helicase [Bacteroidia bacterium]|nr:DEAD/DEAH box helicase [Bacteroidia bacterium]